MQYYFTINYLITVYQSIGLDDMAKNYITIYVLISVDTI